MSNFMGPAFFQQVAAPPPAFVGALDSYTPALWMAAGIKRLLSSYTGSLIRVRRSSDGTEQDVGYLSTGALDTTALATFAGSGDAFIVKVYDQSGGANHLAQATTTQQPKIVSAGTYLGVMRFDGVDDLLVTANATPANAALSIAGRYAIRTLPTGTASQTTWCHENFTISGHNTLGAQYQAQSGKLEAYVWDTNGSSYQDIAWAQFNTSENVDLIVFNRSLSALAKSSLYRNGAGVVLAASAGPGSSAASFTAEKLYIGNAGTVQAATMDGKSFAIWSNSQATNGAAITAAL